MKPRLRIHRGIWHCYVPGLNVTRCGLGFSPADAWVDWKRVTNTEAAAVSAATT